MGGVSHRLFDAKKRLKRAGQAFRTVRRMTDGRPYLVYHANLWIGGIRISDATVHYYGGRGER